MGLLLRGGRVIDPSQDQDTRADLLIEEGRVAAVGPNLYAGGHELQRDALGVHVPELDERLGELLLALGGGRSGGVGGGRCRLRCGLMVTKYSRPKSTTIATRSR